MISATARSTAIAAGARGQLLSFIIMLQRIEHMKHQCQYPLIILIFFSMQSNGTAEFVLGAIRKSTFENK